MARGRYLAVFLHGGPGGHTSRSNTAYFDPTVYRVVLFDQRGAGKSTPSSELRENTSLLLVADIETLRAHLGVPRWHVVLGGSWGSTLALLYAQTHPGAVGSLVLRGVSAARRSELAWSRGRVGAASLFPDAYERFLGHLAPGERDDPYAGYYGLLTSDDHGVRREAAREWNRWDLRRGAVDVGPDAFARLDDERWSLAHARLETHFYVHGAWLEDGQLLRRENLDRIRHIPGSWEGFLDMNSPMAGGRPWLTHWLIMLPLG